MVWCPSSSSCVRRRCSPRRFSAARHYLGATREGVVSGYGASPRSRHATLDGSRPSPTTRSDRPIQPAAGSYTPSLGIGIVFPRATENTHSKNKIMARKRNGLGRAKGVGYSSSAPLVTLPWRFLKKQNILKDAVSAVGLSGWLQRKTRTTSLRYGPRSAPEPSW